MMAKKKQAGILNSKANGVAYCDTTVLQKMLPVDSLMLDTSYQRPLKEGRVKYIADNFSWDSFGAILVAERSDGTRYAVDGGNRCEAAKRRGVDMVPCNVFRSEGPEHEAKVFREANKNRTAVTQMTLFKGLLASGDVKAQLIVDTCNRCGFRLDLQETTRRAQWPILLCAKELQRVTASHGIDILQRTLEAIALAWDKEPEATKAVHIAGISRFLSDYPDADFERVCDVLERNHPTTILRDANTVNLLSSGGRSREYANVLLVKYNKGLRSKRLKPVQ